MQDASGAIAAAPTQRLIALRDSGILDTPPEPAFDELVELACQLCDAPTALVSLVDEERQWFKARIGFDRCETDLGSSVCRFVLDEPDLLVIPDLTLDPRTAANPLVTGQPHIRFYAGAPIRMPDGPVLGSVCVIDVAPRPQGLSAGQARSLRILGRQVSQLLAARRAIERQQADFAERDIVRGELARASQKLQLATEATQLGIFDYDLIAGELIWDDRLRRLFGVAAGTPVTYEGTFLAGLHPDDRERADAAVQAALDPSGSGLFDIEYRVAPLDGGPERWLAARGQAVIQAGRTERFIGSVRDITTRRRAEIALAGTEERYRLAAEATNDAIWDWNLATNHVLWNAALTTAYGHALVDFEPTGDWWIGHIHPDDRERIDRSIHAVIDGSERFWTDEYRFLKADGSYAEVLDRGYVIRDERGRAVRMIGAMLDVTARRIAIRQQAALVEIGDRLRDATTAEQMTREATAIVGRVLGVSRAGFGRLIDGDSLLIEPHWSDDGRSIAGPYRYADFGDLLDEIMVGQPLVLNDTSTDPRSAGHEAQFAALDIRSLVNAPVMDHGRPAAVLLIHDRAPRVWSREELLFIRNVADRLEVGIARLEGESRQQLLNQELSHRLKNTLAMVSSIASQTLRRTIDGELYQSFEQRLFALSRAHEILLQQHWSAARMRDVIAQTIETHGPAERFEIEGRPIALQSGSAMSVALLIHELGSNAAKYGALSTPDGKVRIDWAVEGDGPAAELVLNWTERDGPVVTAPSRRGFGSKLLKIGLGTGQSELRYEPLGVSATFRAAYSLVSAS